MQSDLLGIKKPVQNKMYGHKKTMFKHDNPGAVHFPDYPKNIINL
jgi:hypothetical protein